MKRLFYFLVPILLTISVMSCEDKEVKLPEISLISGAKYISSNDSVTGGSSITIGIIAKKTQRKKVLTKFTISRSIDGGNTTSIFSKELSGTEGDNYSYDFTTDIENKPGQINNYTFTITNSDEITNQVSVKLVIK